MKKILLKIDVMLTVIITGSYSVCYADLVDTPSVHNSVPNKAEKLSTNDIVCAIIIGLIIAALIIGAAKVLKKGKK